MNDGLADPLKTLADPRHLHILGLVRVWESCVCQLEALSTNQRSRSACEKSTWRAGCWKVATRIGHLTAAVPTCRRRPTGCSKRCPSSLR